MFLSSNIDKTCSPTVRFSGHKFFLGGGRRAPPPSPKKLYRQAFSSFPGSEPEPPRQLNRAWSRSRFTFPKPDLSKIPPPCNSDSLKTFFLLLAAHLGQKDYLLDRRLYTSLALTASSLLLTDIIHSSCVMRKSLKTIKLLPLHAITWKGT